MMSIVQSVEERLGLAHSIMTQANSALIVAVALILAHFLGDFVFQSNWMASNKSKDNAALMQHVAAYTTALSLTTVVPFHAIGHPHGVTVADFTVFIAVNAALHFITDYITSRITSRLFMAQFDEGFSVTVMKPGFNLHNFFVVIGTDQAIHGLTLALTAWWLLS